MKPWMALTLTALLGCEASAPPPPPVDTDRLVFKMLTKEQTFDDCVAGADGCTYVRLDYPVLVDAPEEFAVTAVTNAVFSTITAAYGDADAYPNVESLMHAFIDDYRQLKQSQPSYEQPWFLERKVFVLHSTPDTLSLSLSERTFTGGAHGMATVTFTNLSPRTGAPLALRALLIDDYEAKLLPIAEAKFREVRDIKDGMSLADAGFSFFENGVFSLTENFAITDEGLTFYYNVFDVAPYALGPTEITVGYDELEGLLKE